MKKLLLLIPLALLLTACGGNSAPISKPVPDEKTYMELVRSDGGVIGDNISDEQILKLGYDACPAFADGITIEVLEQASEAIGFSQEGKEFIVVVLSAAKVFLCV